MAQVPLQTLEELDLSAEEFEQLIAAGLELSILRVMESEDIEAALAQADQSALDLILTVWVAYVGEVLLPHLDASMVTAGAQTIARLAAVVGNPLTLLTDQPMDTEAYLLQARNRLVGIGDELWVNARAQLAEGIALGESVPKLTTRIRAAIGVTEPRSRVIARTESHGARNVAAMATMQRFESAYGIAPGIMRKQWQSALDARTRPTHVEADNQTVAFNEPFEVGGFSLAFPGDPTGPPQEVIQCRCATFAVFNPEDLNLNDGGTVVTLSAAAFAEENNMPWTVVADHAECAEGQFAVVKEADGSVEGCHDTRDDAEAQMAALYAAEEGGADSRYAAVSGEIVVGNRVTGDRREFDTDTLMWQRVGSTSASLEIPLGYQYERGHGDAGSDKVVRVGRLDSIERQDDKLFARGVIDLQAPRGLEAARLMGTRENPGILAGVSIRVDEDPDGPGLTVEYQFAEGCDTEEGALDQACAMPERTIIREGARVRAVDLVDIPAFAEARLYLDAPLPDEISEPEPEHTVTASAYTITIPELPPADWFAEPTEVPEIGAITVTEEGRFFGYLAPKQVAHRGIREKRVTVPTGNVDYGIWMNRATLVDDGRGGYTKLATGPITMDCGHAPLGPKGLARREHYDNACSVVATARVGENHKGVWIAGALVPGVNADQVARMMACQLSGDWGPHRERPGKRELAAALLVPVPGFPTHHSFTLQGGELLTTNTPLRFGVTTGVIEPVGMRAAASRIATELGRDRETRMREFALNLREILKGE